MAAAAASSSSSAGAHGVVDFSLKLRALGYPHATTFNYTDVRRFRALVVWLEETKIRHYEVAKRTALRDISAAEWDKTFAAYLEALESPAGLRAKTNDPEVVQWLLSTAISAEYSDHAAQYNTTKPSRLRDREDPTEQTPIDLKMNSPEVIQALETLGGILNLEFTKSMSPQLMLKVITKSVKTKFSDEAIRAAKATVKSAAGAAAAKEEKSADEELEMELNPKLLGFTTGNNDLDRAALILRLLFIAELRELQTLINEIIVFVQEYTANPKTDQRLGQVGR